MPKGREGGRELGSGLSLCQRELNLGVLPANASVHVAI
jgi:hypothetical protein